MSPMPKVAIILVKYNQPELEAATIRHVLDTVDYPNWTLVAHQNERGVGLAKTWNRLIASQDAEIIVLLNTDTVPTHGWFEHMLAAIQQGYPAAVPSSNRVHMSQIATDHAWAPDVTPKLETIAKFARALHDAPGGASYTELSTASAMCAMFPKAVWESVGGFDEEFQFYGEDTEFFYRVARRVDPIAWVRGAYVHHYGSQSFAKAADNGELDYSKLRAEANELWLRKKAAIDNEVQSQDNG